MTNPVVIGVLSAIFSALITYFIKSVVDRNTVTLAINARMTQHEKEYHKQETYAIIKNVVESHSNNCHSANKVVDIEKKVYSLDEAILSLKMATAYLVKVNNGDPSEFGLV